MLLATLALAFVDEESARNVSFKTLKYVSTHSGIAEDIRHQLRSDTDANLKLIIRN